MKCFFVLNPALIICVSILFALQSKKQYIPIIFLSVASKKDRNKKDRNKKNKNYNFP